MIGDRDIKMEDKRAASSTMDHRTIDRRMEKSSSVATSVASTAVTALVANKISTEVLSSNLTMTTLKAR